MPESVPHREPATQSRLATENLAILAPLGVVLAWLASLLPVEIPGEVQAAIGALVVGGGSLFLSRQRDRAHKLRNGAAAGLVFVVLLAVLGGCVTYDGGSVSRLAGEQIPRLEGRTGLDPIDVTSCDALRDAASALRNDAGPTRAAYLPLAAGPQIAPLSDRFERLSLICYELEGRDADRGVAGDIRMSVRRDWIRAWSNGRALAGAEEE